MKDGSRYCLVRRRLGREGQAGRVTAFSLLLSSGAGFGRQQAVDYVWRQFMFERQHGLASHMRNKSSVSKTEPPRAAPEPDSGQSRLGIVLISVVLSLSGCAAASHRESKPAATQTAKTADSPLQPNGAPLMPPAPRARGKTAKYTLKVHNVP